MTELDEFKKRWQARDAEIDAGVRIDFNIAAVRTLGRADRAIRRFALGAGLDLAFVLLLIAWLIAFLARFIGELRFALPAVLLLGLLAIDAASLGWQMALARRVDLADSVAATQKVIERLCVARIRYTRWVFILVLLAWTPLLIVGARTLGVDIYRIATWPWLVANFAIGLAAIPLGLWIARFFSQRAVESPWMRRIVRDLAGTNLNAAARFADELARFERE